MNNDSSVKNPDNPPARFQVVWIITGSIAAYKVPDYIRQMRHQPIDIHCVLTKAGAEFVTPLTLASLTHFPVYQDLFSLTDEVEMGHITLARKADAIIVAPATAHIIASMAHGLANDLASTVLLATDAAILIAPAMNNHMWHHPATQRNITQLQADGCHILPPEPGDLACGEVGDGRFSSYERLVEALMPLLARHP